MDNDDLHFEDFWQASSLDAHNVRRFAESLNDYDSDDKELQLEYPTASVPLPKVRTKLDSPMKTRRSQRDFSGRPLTLKEISEALSAFKAWNGLEHRGYPSAGATYVTEIFCVFFRAGELSGQIAYYDAADHGLVTLKVKVPTWENAKSSLNIETTGEPGMMVVFAAFPTRATRKYGERGGRFALLETGAAMQQLALQLAVSKRMKGVAVGGMLDEVWRDLLGLKGTPVHITLGYLVGT